MPNGLKVILVGIILNGFLWQLIIPVWHYPDEQAHFAQIQDMVELGRVPIGTNDTSFEVDLSEKVLRTERDQLGNNYFSYRPQNKLPYNGQAEGLNEQLIADLSQKPRTDLVKRESTLNPPLYYLLAARFYKLGHSFDLFSRVYLVRIFSLCLLGLLCVVAYRTAMLVFENRHLAYVLTIIVGFMPMLVFSSTGILPDPMTNLIMGLVIYLGAKILIQGISWRNIVFFVIALIAGIYTRQQFLIAIPIIVFPLVVRGINSRVKLFYLLGVFLFVGGFVLAASFIAGNVPFVGLFTIPDAGIVNLNEFLKIDFLLYIWASLKQGYHQIFPWYFGVYKWLSLTMPISYYQVIKVVLLVAAAGLSIRVCKLLRNRKFSRLDISTLFFVYASVVYYILFIVWDFLFFKKNGFGFGFQGRYFFPLIIPHMMLLLIGWAYLWEFVLGKYKNLALFSLVFLFLALNLFTLDHITSSYYQKQSFVDFVRNVSNYKPAALKNSTIVTVLLANLVLQPLLLLKLAKELKANG